MMEGGLSVVRIQVVGEHRPAALLSSETTDTMSAALTLVPADAPSGVTESLPSAWGESDRLLVYSPRLSPGDIWIRQRARRLTGMQAADHTDRTEIATVVSTWP